MRIPTTILLTIFALPSIFAQDILTILDQQDDISLFRDLLSSQPDLISHLNTNSSTLLVPTDTAVRSAQSSSPELFSNTSIHALLSYHILSATHAASTITNTSQLIPTLLTDKSYTNVTGGQRVDLIRIDDTPSILSAVKHQSKIIHANVIYQGGLVHIIDSVLQIPLSFPQTITKANLEYLVALLTKGNFIVPGNVANKLALETPDLTIFGPNSPDYGAEFTGWNGKSQDELNAIFMYHGVHEVRYADGLTNGTKLKSLQGNELLVGEYRNGTDDVLFLNNARITGTNYLTANGVLHVIDRPLDPGEVEGPSQTQIEAVVGKKKSVPTGIIVGVVIGGVAVMFAGGLGFALRRRVRKKKTERYQQMPPDYQAAMREGAGQDGGEREREARLNSRLSAPLPARPVSVADRVASLRGTLWPSRPAASTVIELDGKDGFAHVSELGVSSERRRTPPELDGRERTSLSGRSHVSITFHGERPRHIGFQAQY